MSAPTRLKIAVVGTGISGLSAAWLLSPRHDLTVFDRAARIGGHSNTVSVDLGDRQLPVDTGFIVFNRATYPNLVALFEHLGVRTHMSDMSFGVSLDGGAFEYSGCGLAGLFGQPANALRGRFWSMIVDLVRFYREAPRELSALPEGMSLGTYLAERGYGAAFRDDHIVPMGSAIWSAAPNEMLSYPIAAFVRFYENHGLLRLTGHPPWETVTGGSARYVERLSAPFAQHIRRETAVREVWRSGTDVAVRVADGRIERFDHVVIACHADEALGLLADADADERQLLGAFRYSKNLAVLHSDAAFMPKRRAVWASWNYLGPSGAQSDRASVTYWMNRLQALQTDRQLFVTLNPSHPPRAGTLIDSEIYHHPIFDARALAAQQRLWQLQGVRNTWFCGAYFGSGFHEDGLQAGLAVAEQLGGVRRPWQVPNESGRIVVAPRPAGAATLQSSP